MTLTLAGHRIEWYVWAAGVKMRKTSTMRGQWGYDAECQCGWRSRSGGATRRSVEAMVSDHKLLARHQACGALFRALPGSVVYDACSLEFGHTGPHA